jgi:hypothetical protein
VAVDETELKVNGRIVYVWAAMDLDTRELLALEATRSRSAMHAFLFLGGPGKVHQHAAVRRRQGPVVRVGIDVTYSHAFIKPWGGSAYLLPEEPEFYCHCFPQTPNTL